MYKENTSDDPGRRKPDISKAWRCSLTPVGPRVDHALVQPTSSLSRVTRESREYPTTFPKCLLNASARSRNKMKRF